jgi:hypothetical protein
MRTLKLLSLLICCLALNNITFAQTHSKAELKQLVKRTRDLYAQYSLQRPYLFKKLTPEKDSTEEYSRNDSGTLITDIVVNGPFIKGIRRQTSFWYLDDKLFQVYVRMINKDNTIAFGNYFYAADTLYYKYEEDGMQNNANTLLEQSNIYLAKGKQLLGEAKKPGE